MHLRPLPGSPSWSGDADAVMAAATADAEALLQGGCDALLVENMGDVPYVRHRIHDAAAALMACVVERVAAHGVPVGVQVLAGANHQALGIAAATGAAFVRVEGFAYAHVADEGWIDACAGPLLRDRAALGARVAIWADVQKKHAAHAVTADLGLEEIAKGTVFCGADALVVTGVATGRPADVRQLEQAAQAGAPVLVGSGVTPSDAGLLSTVAQGLIVGSWLKHDGDWRRPVDVERVRAVRGAMTGATCG
ncbi:MAG: BtpA/SgcQ family protein [Myxococcales bacterium]|nr:BtpA/SgcQ family protein [Myxococcales bacterium]